jgi:hypothetical protein
VDCKECYRKLSRLIWSTMWIRSDDIGWCHDLSCGALWIEKNSVIFMSQPNKKCYVDWKICDRKLSRRIWCTMWIRSCDGGWCHDLSLRSYVDMNSWYRMVYWPNIYIAMGIGKEVRGIFHDQFNVPCGFEQMKKMMSWSNLKCTVIGIGVKECCHDIVWIAIWTENDVSGCLLDQIEVLYGLEKVIEDEVMT